MSKSCKRLKGISVPKEPLPLEEAVKLLVGGSGVKFDESVDVAIQLGIDPRKSDQTVRGSVVLPAGTGKSVRVGVVASSEEDRSLALSSGADKVGFEDFIAEIGAGKIEFDVLIATPDSMRHLASVAKILGPRGLMPNPKNDTVVRDVAQAISIAKSGQVRFRADKSGIVHAPIGKVSFSGENLSLNIQALLSSLKKIKPASSKGIYLRRLSLSSTMGKGVFVDVTPYR